MSTPIETERKFLIRMPSAEALAGARVKEIEQTYLLCETGNARVRRTVENGEVGYTKTVKRRISSLSCYEDEREISEQEYLGELKNADPSKSAVKKTRYCILCEDHTAEIDIYPFWEDRAILEVELSSESESFAFPVGIKVIKEVSEDERYKNTRLAVSVPFDEI